MARDTAPFLSLGLVTQEWLRVGLPVLVDAETRCELGGEAVTHLDLRSDNICIHEGTVKFIDWAEGGIGSAEVDLGFMLPSLAYEGGPLPDAVMPGRRRLLRWFRGILPRGPACPSFPTRRWCGGCSANSCPRRCLGCRGRWACRAFRGRS